MKTKYIGIRVSEEDFKAIKKDRRKTYDILIEGLTGINRIDLKELTKEYKAIGNNINQVSRIANTTKTIDANNLIKYLKIVEEELKKIKSKYDNQSSSK